MTSKQSFVCDLKNAFHKKVNKGESHISLFSAFPSRLGTSDREKENSCYELTKNKNKLFFSENIGKISP